IGSPVSLPPLALYRRLGGQSILFPSPRESAQVFQPGYFSGYKFRRDLSLRNKPHSTRNRSSIALISGAVVHFRRVLWPCKTRPIRPNNFAYSSIEVPQGTT